MNSRSETLVSHVEKTQRLIRGAVMLTCALVLAIVSISLLFLIDIASTNRANGNQIVECTTPPEEGDKHECYELNEERTAQVIGEIVNEVDRRTCHRMEEALTTALNRSVKLTCEVPINEP